MPVKSWVFQQLAGERKRFTFSGKIAPHGRPRKKPVVSDGFEVRQSRTFFDDGVSTRHIFSLKYHDWDLEGRFRDIDLFPGGAKEKATELARFVADRQPVSIRWGDIISYVGFIVDVQFKREAEHDIEWHLKIEIDEDDAKPQKPPIVFEKRTEFSDVAFQLQLLEHRLTPRLSDGFKINTSALDAIESIVSLINTPTAIFLDITSQIEAFERATETQLRRLVGGAHQVQTALYDLRDLFETSQGILVTSTRGADVAWTVRKAEIDLMIAAILADLADSTRQVELELRGRTFTSVQAHDGDSWESLSIEAYGGPDGAQKLRDANGIKYGERPIPGRDYQVPV